MSICQSAGATVSHPSHCGLHVRTSFLPKVYTSVLLQWKQSYFTFWQTFMFIKKVLSIPKKVILKYKGKIEKTRPSSVKDNGNNQISTEWRVDSLCNWCVGKCGKRNLDSTWKVTSRKQLDIVIVLSTEPPKSTSDSSSTHYLNPLIHKLKHTLKKSGYTDVRYGLVKHGCYQSKQFVHVHTINGYICYFISSTSYLQLVPVSNEQI